MRNTSSPRTFSSIFTNVSPSGNGLTVDLPSSMPMKAQMASARGWLEVPLKIFTMRVLFQKMSQRRTIIFTPPLPSGESGLVTTKKNRRTGGEKAARTVTLSVVGAREFRRWGDGGVSGREHGFLVVVYGNAARNDS